ncbi:MAG: hypothetical protein K6T83_09420 [Alicyclobacillus sp.]|nr:hypothetical protein [Alicyclobacillus sp.]
MSKHYPTGKNGMRLLGLDIGTTSICAVVLDTDAMCVVASRTVPNDSGMASPEPYARLQNADRIWEIAGGLVDAMLHECPGVAGIGLSGQMHGIVYVDERGQAVSPLFTWQDERGNLPYSDGESYAEALSRIFGQPMASGFGFVTHFYHVVHGQVPTDARSLCTIGDYIAMKLAGVSKPVMDPTNAASLGGWADGRIDPSALARAGIDADMLPKVVESGTRVGTTASGIPVHAALGDNQASFVGSGASRGDSLLINIGTGAQLSLWSDAPVSAPGWEVRPFPGGGWLLVAATLGGGKTYALLERFFRSVCHVFTGTDPGSLYARMDALLAGGEHAEDAMVLVPQFFGTRADPHARASITNISEQNFTPAGLTRAFVNGMAEELASLFEALPEEVRRRVVRAVGSGNGMRRNRGLQDAMARRMGLPLALSPFEEEAAVGAALIGKSPKDMMESTYRENRSP